MSTPDIRAALERLHQCAETFPEHDTDAIVAAALLQRQAAPAPVVVPVGEGPSDEETITISYRVEAHDGNSWGFGIRVNPNSRVPESCPLSDADRFETRADAFELGDRAARVCGGTLRVVCLRDHGGLIEVVTAVPIA